MDEKYDPRDEQCITCGRDAPECICPADWDPEELDYLDGFQNLDWPDEPKEVDEDG